MREFIDLCESYITELTGFKGKDEFAAFKNMQSGLTQTGKVGKDISNRMSSMRAFTAYLEANGYKALGMGVYACVFTHPGLDYAIKIFASDKSYLAYVRYVLEHQDNPHFPKFRGRFVKLDDGVYAVRMELLDPIPGSICQRVIDAFYAYEDCLLDPDEPRPLTLKYVFEDYPELEDAFGGIVQVCRETSGRPDLHQENIMSRGGIPVFTDPVAPRVAMQD